MASPPAPAVTCRFRDRSATTSPIVIILRHRDCTFRPTLIDELNISAIVARRLAAHGDTQHTHRRRSPMTSTTPVATEGRAGSIIETRSIDYVPDDERHGKVRHQGPFWFVGNFQPFTRRDRLRRPRPRPIRLGWTIVAGISGICVRHAVHGVPRDAGPGARTATDDSVPRAVRLSRSRCCRSIGTLFTFVGFNVVDVVIIKTGLHSRSSGGTRSSSPSSSPSVATLARDLRSRPAAHVVPGAVLDVAAAVDRSSPAASLFGGVTGTRRRDGRFHARRVPGPVQRRGVLQHHLRAVRLRLHPVPAA